MNNGLTLTLKQNLELMPKTGQGSKRQTIDSHTAETTVSYNSSSEPLGQLPTLRPLGGAGSISGVFQKPDYFTASSESPIGTLTENGISEISRQSPLWRDSDGAGMS